MFMDSDARLDVPLPRTSNPFLGGPVLCSAVLYCAPNPPPLRSCRVFPDFFHPQCPLYGIFFFFLPTGTGLGWTGLTCDCWGLRSSIPTLVGIHSTWGLRIGLLGRELKLDWDLMTGITEAM